MTHVTEDDLDDLEFDTLRTGDHVTAARRFHELAGTVSSGVSRASLLIRSGEQWQHAGEHEKAVELYQSAVDDGGETYGDARAYLADALLKTGRTDEAWALIARIRADASRDPEVYRCMAELLYEHGELVEAHDWATVGVDVARAEGDPMDSLEGLLRLRYRARLDLGRFEDDYDAMLDDLLKKTGDAPGGQFP